MTRGNPNHIKWSDEDQAMLATAYEKWPVVLPPALLARHARHSCHTRAHRLGITRARGEEPLFGHVTPTQWAYLAGIIDGEGTVECYQPTVHGKRRGTWNRAISFVNTDRPLIDWAAVTFPGNSLIARRAAQAGYRDMWQVTWRRMPVMSELAAGLMPFLIVKKEKLMGLLDSFPAQYRPAVLA